MPIVDFVIYYCNVEGQVISADCDSAYYLTVNNYFGFTFDSSWDDFTKNIIWIKDGEETSQSINLITVSMPLNESGKTNIEEYDFYIIGTNDTATIRTNTYHFERGTDGGGTLTLVEEYNIEPITIECTDKTLTITNVPLISDVSNTVIQFTFCPKWDGFVNTVKFYDDSGTLYEVGITYNQATIPEALLIDGSCFFFYVVGTNGDLKRHSQVFKCRYSSGELTVENADNDVLIRLMELIQDHGNEIDDLKVIVEGESEHFQTEINTLSGIVVNQGVEIGNLNNDLTELTEKTTNDKEELIGMIRDTDVSALIARLEALENRQYVGGGYIWMYESTQFSKASPIRGTITADGILVISITRETAGWTAILNINGNKACNIHSPHINYTDPDYRWVNLPVKGGDTYELTTNEPYSTVWKATIGLALYRT